MVPHRVALLLAELAAGSRLEGLLLEQAVDAAAGCPAQVPKVKAFSGLLTWRGTPRATSTLRMATATHALRSTSPAASTSSRGGVEEPSLASSTSCTALPSMRRGDVYVADEGNRRIQVFDGNGTFKKQFANVGTPTAICITSGPRQYLYVAHTGDADGMEDAAIYKLDLEGNIVGKFGKAGKELKQFGVVNSIDCRTENELLVGELTNWRVQKLTLKPAR